MTPLVHRLDCSSPGASPRTWLLVTLSLSVLFLLNEQNFFLDVGQLEDYAPSAEQASEIVAGGNVVRRVSFLGLGLLGAALCFIRPRQRPAYHRLFLAAAAAYVAWVTASLAWSIDPSLTMKRLIILYCSLLCLVGVCRQFGPGDLLWTTWIVALLFVGSSVLIEMIVRRDNPFAGDYRFAGGVHPNTQAGYCAVLAMASLFLALDARRFALPLLLVAVIAFILLFMTKSRAALVGCVLASGLPLSYALPPRQRALSLVLGGWLLVVCCAASALLVANENALGAAVSLGRDQGVANLNGRAPLWSYLLSQYVDGLGWLTGNGYEAFWNPLRVERVSAHVDWSAPNAHSVFVDTLLGAGLIGLVLAVVLMGLGLQGVGRQFQRQPHPQLGAMAALTLFAFCNSFVESSYLNPASFESFFAAGAVLMIAGFRLQPQVQR